MLMCSSSILIASGASRTAAGGTTKDWVEQSSTQHEEPINDVTLSFLMKQTVDATGSDILWLSSANTGASLVQCIPFMCDAKTKQR
jgi:hypothetical protein